MIKESRRQWLSAVWASAAIFGSAMGAAPETLADAVHPQSWPQAHSQGLVDAATEARIDELLAKNESRGKGRADNPDRHRRGRAGRSRALSLGSILAGGNGGPNAMIVRHLSSGWSCRAASTAAAWRPAQSRAAIPLTSASTRCTGHSNMQGRVIFPHNIGLGASHDPELVRRIGAATTEAGGGHGNRLDIRSAVTAARHSLGPQL